MISTYTVEILKEYLTINVGNHWVEGVSSEELEYFFKWLCNCQVYPKSLDDRHWLKGSTGDAFRGFVKGLDLAKEKLKPKS